MDTTNALKTLIATRNSLATAYANEDGGFPGSKGFKAMRKAETALAEFDAAHPEVIAAINAAHSARVAGYDD